MANNIERTGKTEAEWRELIKPVFMAMYDRGVKAILIVRHDKKLMLNIVMEIKESHDA